MKKKQQKQSFVDWLEQMTNQAPSKNEMQEAMDQLKKELVQQQAEKAKIWLRDRYKLMQDRVERIRQVRRKAKADIDAFKTDLNVLEKEVQDFLDGKIDL